jgi:dethiobiotin synthetase
MDERKHCLAGPQHTLAVVGIDTGVGKSYCTGLLAHFLFSLSEQVTTMKLVQTGCSGIAEDILLHRRLMGLPVSDEDQQGLSNPYVFKVPASPHLAASTEGKAVERKVLDQAVASLQQRYHWLVLEGAGGLLVPLNAELLLLDYLASHAWPLILVSSPRLGAINHTRLSLEAIKSRNMNLLGLVYNLHGNHEPEMARDTLRECKRALRDYGFRETVVLMPDVKESAAIAWGPLLAPLTERAATV